jgi:hypothetical protein
LRENLMRGDYMGKHEHDWSHDEVFRIKNEDDGHLTGVMRTCMVCGETRWFHDENSASDSEQPVNCGVLIDFRVEAPT